MPMTIELEQDIEEQLEILSGKTGRSKESCLRLIIEEGLSNIEEYYEASEILERIKKGEERTYTAEEVRKSLGLDD